MARVLGAVRLSRLVDASTSPERQQEQIYTWAKLHGHEVVHVTIDTDVSGRIPASLRPDLGPWMTQPELVGRWDILVSAKLDRVTRSVGDLCDMIDWCAAKGKALASVAEHFDLSTPAGKMVATILASVAQFERERVGERRSEAAEYLRKNGRWGGGVVPYGYAPQQAEHGWVLIPDPAAAAVVEWIAQELIKGRSAAAVAADLDAKGIPTSTGKSHWRPDSLIAMMKSPTLSGYVLSKGQIVLDDDNQPVRREPILDDETWARLQSALAVNGDGKQTSGRKNAAPLLQILFCGLCGQPMYLQRRKDRTDVYRCGGRITGTTCKAISIPAPEVEEMLVSGLLHEAGDVPMRARSKVTVLDPTRELEALAKTIEQLQDDLVASRISATVFASTVERLEARQQALLSLAPQEGDETPPLTGKTFGETWDDLDLEGRRAFLIATGIRAWVRRRASGREPVYPMGQVDTGHPLMITRRTIAMTVNLGDLAKFRDMASRVTVTS
jgi:site-specific DNA recombinase